MYSLCYYGYYAKIRKQIEYELQKLSSTTTTKEKITIIFSVVTKDSEQHHFEYCASPFEDPIHYEIS